MSVTLRAAMPPAPATRAATSGLIQRATSPASDVRYTLFSALTVALGTADPPAAA